MIKYSFKFVSILLILQTTSVLSALDLSDITYITQINKTHFECDNSKNILLFSKFNDDFCDCQDGSDENRTNACINGRFICSNRFYEPKIISTSKVNDGICDCCDGSDEFNLGCPKTCLDLSIKEYDKLMDNFLTVKMIVTNFNEENYIEFFNYHKNLIHRIISTYKEQEEIFNKKLLLKSYLNFMENSMTEENENYVDEHNIGINNIRNAIEVLNNRIRINANYFTDNDHIIKTYQTFSIFRDVNEECRKINYKFYECDLCSNTFNCSGYKAGNKYRQKFFGNLVKFENNVLYFKNGSNCYVYNKQFSANVYVECGSNESISFKDKHNGCHYNFVYSTKMGCNSLKLKSIKDRIKLFIKEI